MIYDLSPDAAKQLVPVDARSDGEKNSTCLASSERALLLMAVGSWLLFVFLGCVRKRSNCFSCRVSKKAKYIL
jgi:hypothetical protein